MGVLRSDDIYANWSSQSEEHSTLNLWRKLGIKGERDKREELAWAFFMIRRVYSGNRNCPDWAHGWLAGLLAGLNPKKETVKQAMRILDYFRPRSGGK